MFNAIFSIAFFIFAALATLIGIIKGKKYRWQLSVSKIVLAIAAAVVAMLASSLVGLGLGSALSGFISSSVADTFPTLKDIEDLRGMFTAIIASLAAPLFFYAFFPIAKALSGSFTFDLAHLLMRLDGDAADAEIEKRLDAAEKGIDDGEYLLHKLKKERRAKYRRRMRQKEMQYTERNILGALCGGIFAFLIFCIYLTPVTGMLTIADDVLPILSVTPIGEMNETVTDIVDGAANNAGAVTVRALGGKALYSGMTTYSVGSKSATLENETKFLSEFSESFLSASALPDENDEEKAERNTKAAKIVRDSARSFQSTNMIPALLVKILPEAISDWQLGEDSFIPRPDGTDELMPVLECLKETSTSTVKADYATLANVYALMLENGLADSEDAMQTYANGTFTQGALKELLSNERFAPAVTNITNQQISSVFKKIDAPQDLDGAYEDFLDDLFATLNESATQTDRATYLKVLNAYAFDSVSLKVTPTTLDTFVAQEIQQFGAALPSRDEFVQFVKETPLDILLRDGTVVHKCLTSQEQLEEYSYTISYKSIKLDVRSVKDSDNESILLTDAFSGMYKFVSLLEGGNTVEAIKAVGPMLDALADSETVGNDNAKLFLAAILQSDDVQDETGLSKLQAISVAESIAKEGNYTEALEAIGNGVSVMEAASGGKASDGDVKALIRNMTASTAQTLKLFFTEPTLRNYGTSVNSSFKATELIGHMLDNMALANERGITEDQLKIEAAAISDVFAVVMNANGYAESNLAFGDNCITGLSAMAHTSRVIQSEIASQTLIDAVYEGKNTATVNLLKMHTTLTEDEQNALLGALNSEWQSAPEQTETLKKTLISIASLSNCEVKISGNEVSLVVPDTEETA